MRPARSSRSLARTSRSLLFQVETLARLQNGTAARGGRIYDEVAEVVNARRRARGGERGRRVLGDDAGRAEARARFERRALVDGDLARPLVEVDARRGVRRGGTR